MSGFDGQDLDALFTQTRALVDRMRGAPTSSAEDVEPARGAGDALDGQIQAVATDGRLESLTLDPRTMRLASADLAAHVLDAVNAALAAARPEPPAVDGAVPAVDRAALSHQLSELQDSSIRQMRAFGAAMDDVLARMRAARS